MEDGVLMFRTRKMKKAFHPARDIKGAWMCASIVQQVPKVLFCFSILSTTKKQN